MSEELIERLRNEIEGAAAQGRVFAHVDRFDLEQLVEELVSVRRRLRRRTRKATTPAGDAA